MGIGREGVKTCWKRQHEKTAGGWGGQMVNMRGMMCLHKTNSHGNVCLPVVVGFDVRSKSHAVHAMPLTLNKRNLFHSNAGRTCSQKKMLLPMHFVRRV